MFGSPTLGAYHGKVTAYVQSHPSGIALTLAILTVLVIILIITSLVYHSKWSKAAKGFRSGFNSPNGSWSGGMHSNWHKGGSIHDQNYFGPGFQHYAQLGNAWQPAVTSKNALRSAMKGRKHMAVARKRNAVHRAAVKRMNAMRAAATRRAAMHREGLDPNAPDTTDYTMSAPGGSPLDANTGYEGEDDAGTGGWMWDGTQCSGTDENGNPLVFDANGVPIGSMVNGQTVPLDAGFFAGYWDPDATAEAQALASVGSYVTDPSGDEVAFQAAISSAYDSNTASGTLTDAQLSALMAGGTAP